MIRDSYLTRKTVAELFGVSPATVSRWARSGRLTSVMTLGGQLRYPREHVEEYVEKRPGTLVVMATHGRTGVIGALMGSVARRVVQSVATPILVIRPNDAPVVPS